MQGEGLDPAAFARVDAAEHAAHWQRSLRFLTLITPYLAAAGPAEGQGRLRAAADALAAAWATTPPAHPIIVAGSTGSRGATRAFMAAVARLPQGALVLPGLDPDLPPTSGTASPPTPPAPPTTPSTASARSPTPSASTPPRVPAWHPAAPPAPDRNALVSLALRPAPVTDQWQAEGAALAGRLAPALASLAWVEAPDQRAEALAIALALREAAETGTRAALVTPDRRSPAASPPSSTAGRSSPTTAPAARSPSPRPASSSAASPPSPASASRRRTSSSSSSTPSPTAPPSARRPHLRLTARLEHARLRGKAPWIDWPTLAAWAEAEAGEAPAWIAWLHATLAPLADARHRPPRRPRRPPPRRRRGARRRPRRLPRPRPLGPGRRRRRPAPSSTRSPPNPPPPPPSTPPPTAPSSSRRWPPATSPSPPSPPTPASPSGAPSKPACSPPTSSSSAASTRAPGRASPPPTPGSAAASAAPSACPAPTAASASPPTTSSRPWAPPRVILTRATRDAEAPTVASRWLLRLENLLLGLGEEGRDRPRRRPRPRRRASPPPPPASTCPPPRVPPARRPAPRPPAAARPAELSVTQVERLVRSPYDIYAQKVLRLRRLDPPGREPDALARGSAIHDALDAFVAATADGLPPDAARVFRDTVAAGPRRPRPLARRQRHLDRPPRPRRPLVPRRRGGAPRPRHPRRPRGQGPPRRPRPPPPLRRHRPRRPHRPHARRRRHLRLQVRQQPHREGGEGLPPPAPARSR